MDGLYYYKLVSDYAEDVTKNCKLSINELDHNFKTLKDNDIARAEFDRENKVLILTRNNNEKLYADLKDVTYNLEIDKECGENGVTLTFTYDGADGRETVVIENVITVDYLKSLVKKETKVITDGTLKGEGNIDSPLGIRGTEKTGMYSPVIGLIDITCGKQLPTEAKLGARYLTKEYINDYGYLYNGSGLAKIEMKLKRDCRGWRIPTKADWDVLLNSIEPCQYRNHNSAKCHIELGKYAGKFLKSECGWLGQPDCECTITKPQTGCTDPLNDGADSYVGECNEYNGSTATTTNGCGHNCNCHSNDLNQYSGWNRCNGNDGNGTSMMPSDKCETPEGVDRYGFGILPSGLAMLDVYGRPQPSYFKEKGLFWTSSHINGDYDQDVYVKDFEWNKGGVLQAAECPNPYYSLRLVKDYDGKNYFGAEYIDGVLYETILHAESGQIWLATNYASKEGLTEYKAGGLTPDVVDVNNGEVVEKRKEFFINEWNGYYWEKKLLKEGDTIVIENPCFDNMYGTVTEVNWTDSEGNVHTIEVGIPKAAQHNMEYRVYTSDVTCDKELINTDDLVVERVINIIVPMIEAEREERIKADEELNEKIDAETSARTEADEIINERIDEEISARTAADEEIMEALTEEQEERILADEQLWEALSEEVSARTAADEELWEALNEEISARTAADEELDAKISAETEARIAADEELDAKISAETEARIAADEELDAKISAETEARIAADEALNEKIDNEIERAIAREDEIEGQLIDTSEEYTIHAIGGLELKLKNGETISIGFDGDYGII